MALIEMDFASGSGGGDTPPLLKLITKKERNDYVGTDNLVFTPTEAGNYLVFAVALGQTKNPWNVEQGYSLISNDGDVGTLIYHDVESSCGCLILAFKKTIVGTSSITISFTGGSQGDTSSTIYIFQDVFNQIDHLPTIWNSGYTASTSVSTKTSTLTDYTSSSSATFGFSITRGNGTNMLNGLTDVVYEDVNTGKDVNMPLTYKDTCSSWGLGIGLFYPKLCGNNRAITASVSVGSNNIVTSKVITFY